MTLWYDEYDLSLLWIVTLFVISLSEEAESTFCSAPRPSRRAVRSLPESCSLSLKTPIVSEASDVWPEELPSWALRDDEWKGSIPADLETRVLSGPPWSVTITNETPLWDLILAKVLPLEEETTNRNSSTTSWKLSPSYAYLAPKGGCDNLCNENERYTDHCTFHIVATTTLSPTHALLVIRTEEKRFAYRLLSDTSKSIDGRS